VPQHSDVERWERRRRELAHCTGTTTTPESTITTYDLYPITVPRPERGQTWVTIPCGTCGQLVGCTVLSIEEAKRERDRGLRSLGAWSLGLACGTGWLVWFWVEYIRHHLRALAADLVGCAFLVVVGLLVAVIVVILREVLAGGGQRLDRGSRHTLRHKGDSRDAYYPWTKEINY
jgi:hypothetical protein